MILPPWISNTIVFGGWAVAVLASMATLVAGLIRVASPPKRPVQALEELKVDIPEAKLAFVARVSTGGLLVIAGLAGVIYVVTQYPKILFALLVLGAGAGAGTAGRRRKGRRTPRRPERGSKRRRQPDRRA